MVPCAPAAGSVTAERESRLRCMPIVVVTAGGMPPVGICSGTAAPGMIVPVASAG